MILATLRHAPFPRGLIFGVGGRDLIEVWRDGPQAYKGTTVSGFPNLFLLMGPNTGLGHNSMIYMIESQIAYVMDALRTMDARGLTQVEVRAHVQERFNEGLQRASAPFGLADRRLHQLVPASGQRPQCRAVARIHLGVPPADPAFRRGRLSPVSEAVGAAFSEVVGPDVMGLDAIGPRRSPIGYAFAGIGLPAPKACQVHSAPTRSGTPHHQQHRRTSPARRNAPKNTNHRLAARHRLRP